MVLRIVSKKFLLLSLMACSLLACKNSSLDINKMLNDLRVEKTTESATLQDSQLLTQTPAIFNEREEIRFKSFASENLKYNISEAILRHPLFVAEMNKFEASKAYVDAAKSTQNVQAAATLLGGIKSEDRKTDPSASLTVSVTKLIYDYGASDETILSVTEKSSMAKIMALVEAEKISANAIGVWSELVRLNRIKKVYSDGLDVARPLLGQIKNISTSGIADKSQLLEAQKRYSALELGVEEVVGMALIAETKFFDIFPGGDLESVQELDVPEVRVDSNSYDQLIKNSNILKGQNLLIKSYKAELRASQLGARPSVAFASTVNAPAKDTMDDGLATLGLSVNYIFNDGGRRVADADALRANIKNVENTIQNQILIDKMNLAVLNQQHRTALKRVSSSKELLRLAQEIADTAKAQLVTGRSSISDVMNASVSTAEAKIALIHAETDLTLAGYGIIGLVEGILNYINWQKLES